MKKGNKYSTYISDGYKEIKRFRNICKIKGREEEYYNLFSQYGKYTCNDPLKERSLLSLAILLENLQTEFYIDDKLYDFLIHTNIKDFKAINESFFWDQKWGCKLNNDLDKEQEEILDARFNVGKVNIWNKKRSILFVFSAYLIHKELFITDGKYEFIIRLDNEYNSKKYLNDEFKLIFNLLLYIECYPNLVLHQAPEWFIKINKNKKSMTIKLHPELCKKEVSPHFRSGHFRRLTSDYYKNKRGQIIYVKSSFVKKENQYSVRDKQNVIEL